MVATISPGLVVLLALVGIAIGVVSLLALVRLGVSLAPLLIPLRSLLVTIRALLLPLAAAVVVGLFNLGEWQVVVGAALLTFAALWLLVLPEREQLGAAVAFDARLVKGAGASVVALLVALTALGTTFVSDRSLESIGGGTAVLLILALVLWLLAFGLRLLSYCSSRLRALVAAFLVLTGYRYAAAIGLVPGGEWISDDVDWLSWALPLAAVVLIALEALLDVVAVRLGEDPGGTEQPRSLPAPVRGIRGGGIEADAVRLYQGLGLLTALLASVALLVSAWFGLAETNQPGALTSAAELGLVAGNASEAPAPPGSYASDGALAAAYAPVLALTRHERWAPVGYPEYAANAILSGPLLTPLPADASLGEKLGVRCPRLSSAPCFRLTIGCRTGESKRCRPSPHPNRADDRLYRQGRVYVRVSRLDAEEATERARDTENVRKSDRWPPQVFRPEGPYADKLSILLQYWYFYRYDEWETHVFAGKLVQRHEGDWEAVTIGLSDSEPLFVAYSAHCAGTWLPWERVVISRRLGARTHPLVAVAEGSHANYPRASQTRSPDWAGCQGAPAGTTTLLGYASNIRDKTEYGWEWYPAEGGIVEVGEDRPPMSFPGYWGASEETVLYGFFKRTQLGKGSGPQTPSEQPLWRDPVTKIFCDNYSQPQLPASLSNYHCRKKE